MESREAKMREFACSKCGTHNRTGAKFCLKCGENLQPDKSAGTKQTFPKEESPVGTDSRSSGAAPVPAPVTPPQSRPVNTSLSKPVVSPAGVPKETDSPSGTSLNTIFNQVDKEILTPLASAFNQVLSPDPAKSTQRQKQSSPPKPVIARSPGEAIGYFRVKETITQSHYPYVVYYLAYNTRCNKCNQLNPGRTTQLCTACGEPFEECLIQHSSPSCLPADEPARTWLQKLSCANIPGMLPYQHIFDQNEQQFLVMTVPPPGWQTLASLTLPQPEDLALEIIHNLARFIQALHSSNLAFFGDEYLDPRYTILITYTQQVLASDLTGSLQTRHAHSLAALQRKDIRILARLLYLLVTGHELRTTSLDAPKGLQKAIELARANQYATLQTFLDDLQPAPAIQEISRGLRQTAGYATHVGNVREHNEDFVGTYSFAVEQNPGESQTGLYIVADGMGGHQAGERASKLVTQTIMDKIHQLQAVPALKGSTRFLGQAMSASEVLVDAIQQANTLLVHTRQSASTGNDRGTTLTAVLIIGNSAIIANVGDSRTYLIRKNSLQQVTKDHSLVASLVSAGLISHEEARSHPQRNQVYRTLGDKSELEVDVFPQVVSVGDCLLLCSDGLWEMVRDETIQDILLNASSPQSACDGLVQAALQAGGEDNISVIVVRLE